MGRPRREPYLPRVGRHRIYERRGARWYCRVCYRSMKFDALRDHLALELRRQGSMKRLEELLRIRMKDRRRRFHLRAKRRYFRRAGDYGVDVADR